MNQELSSVDKALINDIIQDIRILSKLTFIDNVDFVKVEAKTIFYTATSICGFDQYDLAYLDAHNFKIFHVLPLTGKIHVLLSKAVELKEGGIVN